MSLNWFCSYSGHQPSNGLFDVQFEAASEILSSPEVSFFLFGDGLKALADLVQRGLHAGDHANQWLLDVLFIAPLIFGKPVLVVVRWASLSER